MEVFCLASGGFASELEFGLFMAKHDPAGVGLASLVDIMSLWKTFGSDGGVSTQEFLNTAHRSRSVGLRGGEADYVASFSDQYTSVLAGSVRERINSTTVINVLSSAQKPPARINLVFKRNNSCSVCHALNLTQVLYYRLDYQPGT